MKYLLELDEAHRQMVLLALAHLAVERPGWENELRLLALQIDNQADGRALMFGEFASLHRRARAASSERAAEQFVPLTVNGVELDGQELAALAALHDRLNASGLPWRLTSAPGEGYRCEVRTGDHTVEASAPKIRELVTTLSAALVAAATGGWVS